MKINQSYSYKKFLKISAIIFILFLLFHSIIWNLYTSKIFGLSKNYYVGDLGRISYQIDLLSKRKLEYTLQKQHLNKENYRNQRIDIITIGDSFSNGHANGLNPYYQDYLATKYNKNILNIQMLENHNSIDTIIGLYNGGILKELHPQAIIIQTVQRQVVKYFSAPSDFNYMPKDIKIKDILKYKVSSSSIPKLLWINSINYKVPFYMIKNSLNKGTIHNAYKFTLEKNMFSSKTQNKLVVYKDDILNLNDFTYENIVIVNNKLNKLALLLKKLNIKLYFMPAVDKYDLYEYFIVDNSYSSNNFFNIIRKLDKNYYFIDTKKILLPLLENNVKDVFYSDDTHWSYKSSVSIANAKIFTETIDF